MLGCGAMQMNPSKLIASCRLNLAVSDANDAVLWCDSFSCDVVTYVEKLGSPPDL